MQFTKEQITMIRDEQLTFRQSETVSDKLLTFIYDHQLFKLVTPRKFGGKMLDLPSAVKVFQKASFIEGNFGWLVTIGSGGGMFVPNMTVKTANRCYSPYDAVIAGSGFPAGVAKRIQNGYVINGKWLYCSGSQYATTFTVTCKLENSKTNENDIIAFALQPDQVDVLGDWNAFGLQNTSSHSIKITDQFIPDDRVFSVFNVVNDYGGHVHTFPFIAFSEASFVAICLGISEHFLEKVANILKGQINQNDSSELFKFLQEKLQEANKRWQYANTTFHETVQSIWNKHVKGTLVSDEDQKNFSIIAKRVASTTIDCVNNLSRYVGMQMIMKDSEINQIWRDLQTATKHEFLIPTSEIEERPYL